MTEKSPLNGGEGNWFAFLTEFDAPEGDFGDVVKWFDTILINAFRESVSNTELHGKLMLF